jgi:hypothetical protein
LRFHLPDRLSGDPFPGVLHLDFDRHEITVRRGKGEKTGGRCCREGLRSGFGSTCGP